MLSLLTLTSSLQCTGGNTEAAREPAICPSLVSCYQDKVGFKLLSSQVSSLVAQNISFFFFFFFFGRTHSIWKFAGQKSNLSHSSDNARSLTC